MPKEFTDEQLVESLNRGSEDAITEIYKRYWRKLLAIAYNHTKDKIAAEEIVQEVLINLWDRRNQVKINSLSVYLAVAVKYSVLHSIQRQERRNSIAFEVLNNPVDSHLEEEIHTRFLNEYIKGVVEKLPGKCKMVFKYSRFEGKNIPEIAKEMNIAEKTVEAHLTKALKSVRFSLKSAGLFGFISVVFSLFSR
jgi:RNA polymerase sigma-70 factor (family 1)